MTPAQGLIAPSLILGFFVLYFTLTLTRIYYSPRPLLRKVLERVEAGCVGAVVGIALTKGLEAAWHLP